VTAKAVLAVAGPVSEPFLQDVPFYISLSSGPPKWYTIFPALLSIAGNKLFEVLGQDCIP
jgi:hypothetical protein